MIIVIIAAPSWRWDWWQDTSKQALEGLEAAWQNGTCEEFNNF